MGCGLLYIPLRRGLQATGQCPGELRGAASREDERLGYRVEGLLHFPGADVQSALIIPGCLQCVEELKLSGVCAALGEISMLVERENFMLLEGRRNLLDDESCPQLTKYLHKHDRLNVLNLVQCSLRDGN